MECPNKNCKNTHSLKREDFYWHKERINSKIYPYCKECVKEKNREQGKIRYQIKNDYLNLII